MIISVMKQPLLNNIGVLRKIIITSSHAETIKQKWISTTPPYSTKKKYFFSNINYFLRLVAYL